MDLDFLMFSQLMGDVPPVDPKVKEWLQKQKITEKSPGRILKDWQTFLDFIGSDGVEVTGKNDYFPMKLLPEINASLSQPIEIDLKRPQQKSYPYIHGLYLLVRLLGLASPIRQGKKSKLMLNQDLLKKWQKLNVTEHYLILLEVAVFWVSIDYGSVANFLSTFNTWMRLPEKKVKITKKNAGKYNFDYLETVTHFALFDLLGLVKLESGKPLPGKGWNITAIEKTAFGEAMMKVLIRCFMSKNSSFVSYRDNPMTYGELQPLLQEYFPKYQHKFTIPDPNESRKLTDGIYQFKVSLGRAWRRILISSDSTLEPLVDTILKAFDFDKDHLYQFICKNRLGNEFYINHQFLEQPPYTDNFLVKELPLQIGDTMIFLFDFGDNWGFSVLLEGINPPDKELTIPIIEESKGKAPMQYEDWDEHEY
ncbi:MAG: plasmid pRiA4b ORF-3 family protein [Crocosphaera sp.]